MRTNHSRSSVVHVVLSGLLLFGRLVIPAWADTLTYGPFPYALDQDFATYPQFNPDMGTLTAVQFVGVDIRFTLSVVYDNDEAFGYAFQDAVWRDIQLVPVYPGRSCALNEAYANLGRATLSRRLTFTGVDDGDGREMNGGADEMCVTYAFTNSLCGCIWTNTTILPIHTGTDTLRVSCRMLGIGLAMRGHAWQARQDLVENPTGQWYVVYNYVPGPAPDGSVEMVSAAALAEQAPQREASGPVIEAISVKDGRITFRSQCAANGTRYRVQRTYCLAPALWEDVGEVETTAEAMVFDQSVSDNPQTVFYRIRIVEPSPSAPD